MILLTTTLGTLGRGRPAATHLPHRDYRTEHGEATATACHPTGRQVRSGGMPPSDVVYRPIGSFAKGHPDHDRPSCKVCAGIYEAQWELASRFNRRLRAAEPEPSCSERSAVRHEPPRARGWGDVYTWNRRLCGGFYDFQLVVMPTGRWSVAVRRLTEHPAEGPFPAAGSTWDLVHTLAGPPEPR